MGAHIEQIARDSTHLIWEEVVAYRETPLFDDVVHYAGEIFEVFTSTVLQGRSPQASDFPFTSGHTTLWVEHGISLVDYLVASSDAAADRLIEPRVRAYLDGDMNAKVAAARLHIHVNTIHYRIAQILECTGLDLRRFEDATQLLLAVRLLEGR